MENVGKIPQKSVFSKASKSGNYELKVKSIESDLLRQFSAQTAKRSKEFAEGFASSRFNEMSLLGNYNVNSSVIH
jgi:hypothetical protein